MKWIIIFFSFWEKTLGAMTIKNNFFDWISLVRELLEGILNEKKSSRLKHLWNVDLMGGNGFFGFTLKTNLGLWRDESPHFPVLRHYWTARLRYKTHHILRKILLQQMDSVLKDLKRTEAWRNRKKAFFLALL